MMKVLSARGERGGCGGREDMVNNFDPEDIAVEFEVERLCMLQLGKLRTIKTFGGIAG